MHDFIMMMLANTLGESILVETLRSAAYFITHSAVGINVKHHVTRNLYHESKKCYFFMQGTGLDQLIETYSLDYDPETIREGFNFYIRRTA